MGTVRQNREGTRVRLHSAPTCLVHALPCTLKRPLIMQSLLISDTSYPVITYMGIVRI